MLEGSPAHLVWWAGMALGIIAGGFGGFVNALLAGGEHYKIMLPGRQGREFEFGVTGPIIVGMACGFVSWGGALRQVDPGAALVGALLAGIAGGNYLTSQVKVRNLTDANRELAQSADTAAETVVQQALEGISGESDSQEGSTTDDE